MKADGQLCYVPSPERWGGCKFWCQLVQLEGGWAEPVLQKRPGDGFFDVGNPCVRGGWALLISQGFNRWLIIKRCRVGRLYAFFSLPRSVS